jgi:hypothetical protein
MTGPNHVVASFDDYVDAERAVDSLADRRFPVRHLAVVGVGLQSYEQFTGPRRYRRAATKGGTSGAAVGFLVGWLLGLFTRVEPLASAAGISLWGLVIGAVTGASIGLVRHAMTGGRRDFSSTSTLRAERYDLVAEAEFAVQARRLLTDLRAARRAAG